MKVGLATTADAATWSGSLPKSPVGWLELLGIQVLFALVTFGLAGIGAEMAQLQNYAPLVWPPAGFTLAMLFIFGLRFLPGLAVGLYFSLHYIFPTAFALLAAGEQMLTLLACAFLLRHVLRIHESLERIVDVFYFIVIAAIGVAVVSAALSTALICAYFDAVPWSEFERVFIGRFLGLSLGITVVGPISLVWHSKSEINWSNRQTAEVLAWLSLLILFGIVIFRNWAPTDTLRYPLELAMFPILSWGAIRFGQRGATTGILILSIMAVWELRDVIGPDATKFHTQPPSYLWVFVGILSITALFLAAILAEHRNREKTALTNEQRLRAFVDAMPDTAFVVGIDGMTREVFASRQSLYRGKEDEVVGKPLSELYDEATVERLKVAIRDALRLNQLQVVDYPMVQGNERYWLEGRITPLETSDKAEPLAIWMAYDITARKVSEQTLELRDRILNGVANSKTILLTKKETEEAISAALELVGRASGVDRLYLAENRIEEDFRGFRQTIEWRRDGGVLEGRGFFGNVKYDSDLPGWFYTLGNREYITGKFDDFPERIKRTLSPLKDSTVLVSPVHRDAEFWGFLLFVSEDTDRSWGESEAAILSSVAASIGGFLESKRIEQELQAAKESADKANMAKGEFLAMMSHEIRTPMNAILGFADLLAQTEMEEGQKDYLKIINRSGKALLELINNILDYSKIESKSVELEEVPMRVEDVLIEALELVLVKAREKAIKVDFNIEERINTSNYLGDPTRLKQILLNLLNNAVKFTDKGMVRADVSLVSSKNGKHKMMFGVKDSGIGIEKERVDRLFKPFSQVDSSTTRKYGGTGLGLVICKRLVERMGGEIWVDSIVGQGSTFFFTINLPLTEDEVKIEAGGMDNTVTADFAKACPLEIILAEDDPNNQRLMVDIMDKLGYAVRSVESGEAVLDLLKEKPADIVLMDVQMPGLDGFAATTEIRKGTAGESVTNTRIVAVTAFALEGDRDRCLAHGMDDYLSKPIQVNELKAALQRGYEAKQRTGA